MKAWHFVGETLRDGRPVPSDGEWLVHDGELIMCESGLHASVRPIDALRYAPGNTICRVEVDGEMIEDDDKLVAIKRKIIWRIDGKAVLRAFSRWCALQAVHLWDAPDVVIEYLTTGDESIRDAALAEARDAALAEALDAARATAWATARAAALDAALDAALAEALATARAAALDAALDAALAEALDAARAAALDAAWAAALAEARDAALAEALDAARAAAWAAAWDAARDAAWAAQNEQFKKMVKEAKNGKSEWVFDVPVKESEE